MGRDKEKNPLGGPRPYLIFCFHMPEFFFPKYRFFYDGVAHVIILSKATMTNALSFKQSYRIYLSFLGSHKKALLLWPG